MQRLRITHTTTYRYSQRLSFGPHRLVLRPREGHDLQVEQLRLEITPSAKVSWHRDIFGNSIARADFLDTADELTICNEVTIVQGDQTARRGLLEAFPISFPVTYSSFDQPVAAGYMSPVYPDESRRLHQWIKETFPTQAHPDAAVMVNEIGTWIYRNIQYRRREDKGVQTPWQTLEMRSGSCRDMATLLLEAVRPLGLASRFASGYLNSSASQAGRAATHAWTEIYFSEHGWYGFDPTIGEGTSHKHIVTGVSSHPRGVMPISGSYNGEREVYLGMEVSVKIENLPMEGTQKDTTTP